MKHTALFEEHRKLGGKLVSFAGYNLPVEFSGVNDEHITVRQKLGVFDVSHMGEIWVKGAGAFELLQRITTNDVSRLFPGKIQYSCLPNGKGGIVDDILVYQFDEQKYLLVVNAANVEKDWSWINEQNSFGATLENSSEQISQIAVQGPDTIKALQGLTTIDLQELKFYTFTEAGFAGIENVIISATGYTGAGGFELYFSNEAAVPIWNKIFESGQAFGIKPAGLAARDTLRLEMGFCLYGNDIDDTTSPIEAGLSWITKFTDEKDFIDKEFLYRQKTGGVSRKLTGFRMIDRGIPRQNYQLFDEKGNQIGRVTSGTMSPLLKTGIGMGYLAGAFSQPGKQIFVSIRDRMLAAETVRPPFINLANFLN